MAGFRFSVYRRQTGEVRIALHFLGDIMRHFALFALVLGLVACRDSGGGDDTLTPDGSTGSEDMTIQEIRNDAMPAGTPVTIKGAVVVAIDAFGKDTQDVYVSEPEGGPYSGIKIYRAPVDQIAALEPGDIVDISGAIKFKACLAEQPCGSVTFDESEAPIQLVAAATGSMTIKKAGTGEVPAPAVLDAKQLAAMPKEEREAEWKKYEGALLKVVNARQLNDVKPFGNNPGPDSTEFRITGVARVQSELVELPATSVVGTCYDSITGVGDWFFNYIVSPRSEDDLVAGGSACHPMVDSISALRSASTPPELVKLTDVYVAAVAFNKRNLWVSSSLTAAENEGVFVYRGTTMSASELPAEVVAGAKVTVYGEGIEFDGNNGGDTLTQVTSPSITVVAAPGNDELAPVTGKSVTELLAAQTGDGYEGVLVTLTNVKVVTVGTSGNNNITDLAQYPGNVAFKADDDIYRFVAGDANKCYASITGIWTYNAFDDQYMFLPRAVGTGTGTCD